MMPLHHKSLASLGLIVACGLWLAGCAGGGAVFIPGSTDVVFSNQSMSVQQAEAALTIGQSTKAEVLAALGPATTLRFDSGQEVWVYRGKPLRVPATGAEFVILFAPSGTVQKTRTRPAYDGLTR
jgi:hypothetical protein